MTSQEDAFQQAVAVHQAGRLQEAEHLYRSILHVQPNHAEANHNLGMIAIQSKRPAAALPFFKAAIEANPDQGRFRLSYVYALLQAGQKDAARQALAQSLHLELDREAVEALSGVLANHSGDKFLSRQEVSLEALFAEGKFSEARAVAENLTLRFPLHGKGWMALGMAGAQSGETAAAVAAFQKAAALLPDDVEAHFNLCIALKLLHRQTEAEASCRRALALKPDLLDAHAILGSILHALGREAEAEASLQRALELEVDPAEGRDKIASLLIADGHPAAAFYHVLRSLQTRESERARRNFVFCVKYLSFTEDGRARGKDGGVRAFVLRALTEPWARPSEMATVAIDFVKLNPVVLAGMAGVDSVWPPGSPAPEQAPPTLLGAGVAAELADDPLFCALLNATPVCDVELERFLTLARRALLEAAMTSTATDGAALEFYGALVKQCFINEYVFFRTEDEVRKAGKLRDELCAALEAGTQMTPLLVLAVAAYFPLGSLPCASRLLDAPWPEEVAAVLVQQVREPEEELRLRGAIPRLTAIDDEISLRVQGQYEENPYPRWLRPEPAGNAKSLAAFLSDKFPEALLQGCSASESPDILIAGCGTGQQSVETSRRFPGARVLAMDLSMRSLGYARRKTEELGLARIEYAQADLLQLNSLERRFDLVECVGVLHHLTDPWAGWRVLLSLLRPGGFMRLGFYSALARRNIVKARALIAEKRYGATADEIRRCRQDLLGPDAGAELRSVTSFSDFFSISACRDLLFHVQEHRMNLAQIASFIGENGLALVGFDVDEKVLQAYRKRFPGDRAAIDLGQWQRFENDNPDTFIGMYQFWVQKAS